MPIKKKSISRNGTEKMFSTPSQDGTYLYFTSKGDDISSGVIGKGQVMAISNQSGLLSSSVECQFSEDIFLKDGFLFWENAIFGDTVSLEIILPANTPVLSAEDKGNAAEVNGVITYITASQTPDETWTGTHNLFPMDFVVNRFVNSIYLMGANHHGLVLESSETALVSSIMKFRLTYKNVNTTVNNDIRITTMLEMYRKNTV